MITMPTKAAPVSRKMKSHRSAQIPMATHRSRKQRRAAEEMLREMAFVYHLARSIRKEMVEPASPGRNAAR